MPRKKTPDEIHGFLSHGTQRARSLLTASTENRTESRRGRAGRRAVAVDDLGRRWRSVSMGKRARERQTPRLSHKSGRPFGAPIGQQQPSPQHEPSQLGSSQQGKCAKVVSMCSPPHASVEGSRFQVWAVGNPATGGVRSSNSVRPAGPRVLPVRRQLHGVAAGAAPRPVRRGMCRVSRTSSSVLISRNRRPSRWHPWMNRSRSTAVSSYCL
jgi:hypothetical protein